MRRLVKNQRIDLFAQRLQHLPALYRRSDAVGHNVVRDLCFIFEHMFGRIAETIRISRRTHAVLWQNITLALGLKLVFFVLAVFGNASMWMAVFADMGASLLVVANGLRLLRMDMGMG